VTKKLEEWQISAILSNFWGDRDTLCYCTLWPNSPETQRANRDLYGEAMGTGYFWLPEDLCGSLSGSPGAILRRLEKEGLA